MSATRAQGCRYPSVLAVLVNYCGPICPLVQAQANLILPTQQSKKTHRANFHIKSEGRCRLAVHASISWVRSHESSTVPSTPRCHFVDGCGTPLVKLRRDHSRQFLESVRADLSLSGPRSLGTREGVGGQKWTGACRQDNPFGRVVSLCPPSPSPG